VLFTALGTISSILSQYFPPVSHLKFDLVTIHGTRTAITAGLFSASGQ
jgi:hypothetical protein